MKLKKILFFSLIFLIGCTNQDPVVIEENPPPIQEEEPPSQEQPAQNGGYYMNGDILVGPDYVRISGTGNLLKDTVLTIMVDDKKVATTKVEKNGEFYIAFSRTDSLVERHNIFIVMRPELQPKDLQQVYGETGENLTGNFVYNYSQKNKQFKGLKGGTSIESLGGRTVGLQYFIESNKTLSNPKTVPEE